jgi:hypothetical protein
MLLNKIIRPQHVSFFSTLLSVESIDSTFLAVDSCQEGKRTLFFDYTIVFISVVCPTNLASDGGCSAFLFLLFLLFFPRIKKHCPNIRVEPKSRIKVA